MLSPASLAPADCLPCTFITHAICHAVRTQSFPSTTHHPFNRRGGIISRSASYLRRYYPTGPGRGTRPVQSGRCCCVPYHVVHGQGSGSTGSRNLTVSGSAVCSTADIHVGTNSCAPKRHTKEDQSPSCFYISTFFPSLSALLH